MSSTCFALDQILEKGERKNQNGVPNNSNFGGDWFSQAPSFPVMDLKSHLPMDQYYSNPFQSPGNLEAAMNSD